MPTAGSSAVGMDESVGAGLKPPGERTRGTMPLLVLLSGAGMGPLIAFFACRGMNLYAHTLGYLSAHAFCESVGQAKQSPG